MGILSRESWLNLARKLWEREVVEKLDAHQDDYDAFKASIQFIGYYDQVNDVRLGLGGMLDSAANYAPGAYFLLTVTGAFATTQPNLAGESGIVGDRIVSDGAVWTLVTTAGEFISKVTDDTAAGVITFTPTPRTTAAAPTLADELTRKDYVDAADAAHAALTAAADNVHDVQGYVQVELGPYARLDASNLFTAHPQIVRSSGATGQPAFDLERSDGLQVLSLFYGEADSRTNLISYEGALFLQNRDPGGPLPGVVVGDNTVVSTSPPGTLTAEVDLLIGPTAKSVVAVLDYVNTDGPFARLAGNNDFQAPQQRVVSQSGTDRPSLQMVNSAGPMVLEMYYNEPTDATAILATGGRTLSLQPGASGGVSVRSPTYAPVQGELSVEGDAYSGPQGKLIGEAPIDGNAYQRKDAAWAEAPLPSAGLGAWTWAGVGIGLVTGPGTFRTDSATYSAATEFRFNRFNGETIDVSAVLMLALAGDFLYLQNIQDATSGGLYLLTQVPTQDPGGDVIFQNLTPQDGSGVMAGPVTMLLLSSVGSHVQETNPHDQYMLESDALAVFAYAAYGGLSLATPGVGASIGVAWETVQFDAVVPATPRSVTASTIANTIAYHADGVYALTVTINVVHNSSTQGRTFNLRLWNVTEAARIGNIIVVTTGRNADGSHMSITTLVEIGEAQKNHPIRLEIGNTSDSYSAVLWDVAELVTWGVGEYRETLPSDS